MRDRRTVAHLFILGLMVLAALPQPLGGAHFAHGQVGSRSLPESGRLRLAYYFPPDPASLVSLRDNLARLDVVAPHWLTIDARGVVAADERPEAVALLRAGRALVLPSVMVTDAAAGHSIVSDAGARTRAIENLLAAVAPWDGLALDFEGLDAGDREDLSLFINALGRRLREAGKLHLIALPAKSSDLTSGWSGAYQYTAIADAADLFLVMAYGWRTSGSREPGSTAPLPWVEACMQYAARTLPPDRVLLGVPFYGYDWNVDRGPPARALRFRDTQELITRLGVTPTFDSQIGSATFTYREAGEAHEVWYDDARALQVKLDLIGRLGLRGAGAWRLGQEDPSAWAPWDAVLGPARASGMTPSATPTPGRTVAPVDPGSGVTPGGAALVAGAAATLWANPGDAVTLRAVNPGNTPATIVLRALYDSGAHSRLERTLAGGATLALELSTGFGQDAGLTYTATVPVTIDVTTRAADGTIAAIPVTETGVRWVFPDLPAGSETAVLVLNPGSRTVSGTARLRTTSGELVQELPLTLAEGKRRRFTFISSTTQWFELMVDGPVVASRQSRLATTTLADIGTGLAARWSLPTAGLSEAWNGALVIANPNASPATVRARWVAEGEERTITVPPYGRSSFEGPAAADRSSAEVVADQPVGVLRVFADRYGTEMVTQTGLPRSGG